MATHLRFGLAGVTFGIALGIGWIIERDDGQGRAAVAVMAPPAAFALPHLLPALTAPPETSDLDMPASVMRGPLRPAPMPLSAPSAPGSIPEAFMVNAGGTAQAGFAGPARQDAGVGPSEKTRLR